MSELIIKVDWHSPVQINYQCCKIITQEDWERIQEVIESDIELSYSNAPKWWEESFRSKELKKAFILYSGPECDDPHSDTIISDEYHKKRLGAFRKLFPNGEIGDTSIIDLVLDSQINFNNRQQENNKSSNENEGKEKILTKELAEGFLSGENISESVGCWAVPMDFRVHRDSEKGQIYRTRIPNYLRHFPDRIRKRNRKPVSRRMCCYKRL